MIARDWLNSRDWLDSFMIHVIDWIHSILLSKATQQVEMGVVLLPIVLLIR